MAMTPTQISKAFYDRASRIFDRAFTFLGDREEEIFTVVGWFLAIVLFIAVSALAYAVGTALGKATGAYIALGSEIIMLICGALYFVGSRQSTKQSPTVGIRAVSPPIAKASMPKLIDGWYEICFFDDPCRFHITYQQTISFEARVCRWLADSMSDRYLVLNARVPVSRVLFKSLDDAMLFRMKFDHYGVVD